MQNLFELRLHLGFPVDVASVSGSAFGEEENASRSFESQVLGATPGADACLLVGGWNSRVSGCELEELPHRLLEAWSVISRQ